ncbi:hypothetical protein ACSV9I_07750 [Rhizobium sp. G187]|uniref:hypothetical protein n=1 Tax=Rhizobium sp. G187 TaxID=3451352 RepID=UPI003EE5C925
MFALLPGLLIRYSATLIGLQVLMFILMLVAESLGWSEDLFRAANVAVLIGSATTAGNYVALQLRGRPSWPMSLGLAFFMSLTSILLGVLMFVLIIAAGGVEMADINSLVDEIGIGAVGAALVFIAFGLLLAYPVTLVGLRIGAGGTAKQIAKEEAAKLEAAPAA